MKTNSTRLVLLAALLSTAAFAQAPNKVAYQGLLLKNDGTPETGMVSIKFSVFDAAANGTELWTETQPNVVLTQGYYSTVLGEVTAFPANALDGTERFLEISVGGTALSPRMRVVSVPYAVRANNATNVTGGTVNASSISINGTTVIDGIVDSMKEMERLEKLVGGDANVKILATLNPRVLPALAENVNAAFRKAGIPTAKAVAVGDKLFLEGSVADEAELKRALSIAHAWVGNNITPR